MFNVMPADSTQEEVHRESPQAGCGKGRRGPQESTARKDANVKTVISPPLCRSKSDTHRSDRASRTAVPLASLEAGNQKRQACEARDL